MEGDHDVLEYTHIREKPDILKSTRDAACSDLLRRKRSNVLFIENHPPGRRNQEPRDHIEHRGFSGPVGANQSDEFAGPDGEGKVIDGGESAEPHHDIFESQ